MTITSISQYKITSPTFSDPDRRLCFIVFTNSLLVFFVTKVTAHLYLNRHKYERVLLCAVDGKEMDSPQSDTKTKGATPCPDTSAGGRHRDTPHTYTVLKYLGKMKEPEQAWSTHNLYHDWQSSSALIFIWVTFSVYSPCHLSFMLPSYPNQITHKAT